MLCFYNFHALFPARIVTVKSNIMRGNEINSFWVECLMGALQCVQVIDQPVHPNLCKFKAVCSTPMYDPPIFSNLLNFKIMF